MKKDIYTATDGTLWTLAYDPLPIPTKDLDWSAIIEDYDGAPDAFDYRYVAGPTRDGAIEAVERLIRDTGTNGRTIRR